MLEELYNVKRNRAGEGAEVTQIDLFTDRTTRSVFRRAFASYLKNQGVTVTVQLNEVPEFYQGAKTTNVGSIKVDSYYFSEAGVTVNVTSDLFADDFVTAASKAGLTRRFIWAIDWSDIVIGIAKTTSATRIDSDASANPHS